MPYGFFGTAHGPATSSNWSLVRFLAAMLLVATMISLVVIVLVWLMS